MTALIKRSWNSAAAFLSGLTGSTLLAVAWNAIGFATGRTQVGYELTHYFTPISWSFVFAFAIIAMLLGAATGKTWPVGLGMISTLPIACGVEVARDSTSHNLIPFEILLTWVPAFLLGFGAAFCGAWLRKRKLETRTL